MNKELYINEQLVDLSDDTTIALNSQINDIGDIQTRNGNYTNQFKVPKTITNNKIFGFADLIESATTSPYKKLSCKFIDGGVEIVPAGFAIIEQSSNFYELTIYSGNSDFFALIDGLSLRDLNLSDLDHQWVLTVMDAMKTNTSGIIYPMIDYGKVKKTKRSVDATQLFPAIFAHTLIERIVAKQIGWTLEGEVLTNEMYLNHVIPFSDGDFKNNNQKNYETSEFISPSQSLSYDGLTNQWVGYIPVATDLQGADTSGNPVDYGGPQASPLLEVKNTTEFQNNTSFIAPTTGRIKINYKVKFKYNSTPFLGFGGFNNVIFPSFIIWNKSAFPAPHAVLKQQLPNDASYLDGTFGLKQNISNYDVTTEFEIETNVFAGDEVYTDFHIDLSVIGGKFINFTFDIEIIDFLVSYQPQIISSEIIHVSDIVPDMSQSDFMKGIFNQYGVSPDAVGWNRTLKLRSFDELIENIPNAKDWSDKATNEPESVSYRVNNYGQRNNCLYIQDGQTVQNYAKKQLGDSMFLIADETLPQSVDVIKLPFASTKMTKSLKYNYDFPFIDKIDDKGLPTKSVSTRCLILKRGTGDIWLTEDVYNTGITDIDNGSFTGVAVQLTNDIPFAFFSLPGESNNLDWDNILSRYYKTITTILNNYKALGTKIYLKPMDVENFDHFIPVYLSKHSSYFYVNKINNFVYDKLTQCELIKI